MATATQVADIEQWNIKQFLNQGFDLKEVVFLMDQHISYHDTDDLIQKGCTHDLAIQILQV